MAKTSAEGFSTFLSWLTPSQAERTATASHRESVYNKLNANFTINRMFESGSFKHGTGISGHSDVDYILSLKQSRPDHSSSILTSIRTVLLDRFPTTYIHVSRPAVIVDFGGGSERVEVIPAYPESKANGAEMRYRIPGITTEWIWSTPEAHLAYVNDVNSRSGISGGAKSLARLAKAWKYYRKVPISSFYLEMRAAAYMATQSTINWPYDISIFLGQLQSGGLAAMNDPTGNAGRIEPCSSTANHDDAVSKLDTASSRASKAVANIKDGKTAGAFAQWDLLWNGKFPSY